MFISLFLLLLGFELEFLPLDLDKQVAGQQKPVHQNDNAIHKRGKGPDQRVEHPAAVEILLAGKQGEIGRQVLVDELSGKDGGEKQEEEEGEQGQVPPEQ